MRIFSTTTREFALMALPCALFLGITLLNSNNSRNEPNIDYAVPVMPTSTPTGFYAKISQFKTVPVTPHQAALGADTNLKIRIVAFNASPNVQWYYARRLVASKNGRSRVLWHDNQEEGKTPSLLVSSEGTRSVESRNDELLLKLRDVPPDAGELVFICDALAQPTRKARWESEKFVDIATLNRVAKRGGVLLSRRVTLRRAGQKIRAKTFPDTKPLRVVKGEIFAIQPADPNGNDIQIELRLTRNDQARSPVITLSSVTLTDNHQRDVSLYSYDTGAMRQGDIWVFRAMAKRRELHGAKQFRITVMASDGKTKEQKLSATATLQGKPRPMFK